ncbi:hypothetical protein EBX93_15150, partial [bacterium]|nr:hypothetical protein [bacterium]
DKDVEDVDKDVEDVDKDVQTTCLLVGDLHYQPKNLDDARTFSSKLVALVKERKPTFVVLLGDLLHTNGDVKVVAHNVVIKLIKDLKEISQVYVLIGNHDLINHTQFLTENHIFNPLKEWKNVVIVDKPVLKEYGQHMLTFCPYVPKGRFKEALENVLTLEGKIWENSTCIFAHQEFKGCKMGAAISEDGDEWDENLPPIFSGHIHDSQVVGKNIYYVGSAMQHSYAEKSEKAVWLISFKEDKNFSCEKIDLKMKKKKILYYKIEEVESKFNVDQTKTYDIKLVLEGSPEQFKTFRKSKYYKLLVDEKKVKVSFQTSTGEAPTNSEEDLTAERQMISFEEVMDQVVHQSDEQVQNEYLFLKALIKEEASLEDDTFEVDENDDSENDDENVEEVNENVEDVDSENVDGNDENVEDVDSEEREEDVDENEEEKYCADEVSQEQNELEEVEEESEIEEEIEHHDEPSEVEELSETNEDE